MATDYCFEAPKPLDFGDAGKNWSDIGWKVPVFYHFLRHKIRPGRHMDTLVNLLPEKYSSLSAAGNGQQAVYLAAVPLTMADALVGLIGEEARSIVRGNVLNDQISERSGVARDELIEWEQHLVNEYDQSRDLSDTERTAVIKARRGQGTYRKNVLSIEQHCRITRVDREEHLIASHCKPWRDCDDVAERLDGENGLMLTPTFDHLFDRGFISFENTGRVLVSPRVHKPALKKMGLDPDHPDPVGEFSEGQKKYLDFHRERVFLFSGIKTAY